MIDRSPHQLALVTPGSLAGVRQLAQADAAEAELAEHRVRRPQRRQRVYARTLNLGLRCCLLMSAFFAIGH
jgi:hypothetical protein